MSCAEMNGSAQEYCDLKYDYVWIMGGIDFDTTTDQFGGFEINFNDQPLSINPHPKFVENPFQNASICNRDGELLFYSNGCQIINASNMVVEFGDTINSSDDDYGFYCPELGYGGCQNMISIPDAYNDSIYYLFYLSQLLIPDPNKPIILFSDRFNYAKIVFNENNISGKVLTRDQPILIDTSMIGTPVTAAKHANGRDWWIITPNRWSNSFNIIYLGPDGPVFMGRQYIGDTPYIFAECGQGKFSPDGRHFAWFHPLNGGLFVYDFDRENGVLSGFRKVVTPASNDLLGGCEFSPSGRFLYFSTTTQLYQVDMSEGDIQSSLMLIAEYDGFADPFATRFYYMERTPDHRIFMNVTNGSRWLHIIQDPDQKGLDCRFEQHTLKFPFVNNFTLPHFPNYRLGALDDPLCDTVVGTHEIAHTRAKPFTISPIPASTVLSIHPHDPLDLQDMVCCLYTLQGYEVLRSSALDLDISMLPPGIYFAVMMVNGEVVQQEKVVIQH